MMRHGESPEEYAARIAEEVHNLRAHRKPVPQSLLDELDRADRIRETARMQEQAELVLERDVFYENHL